MSECICGFIRESKDKVGNIHLQHCPSNKKTPTLSSKRHPDWKPRTDVKGWYLHDDIKQFLKDCEDRLVDLFDVYEIKVINEGNEMTLRKHELRRMIKMELNTLTGDDLT